MDVKIKDRKKEIEYLRIACNMAEIGIEYQHADLILRLQERLNKLKGKFTILDGVEIHHKWQEDWEKYFNELANNVITTDDLSNKETTHEELPTNKTLVKDWVKTLPKLRAYRLLRSVLLRDFSEKYVEDINKNDLLRLRSIGKISIDLFIQHRGY